MRFLNEVAARLEHHIMNIKSCTTFDHFDRQGNLSQKGKEEFWYEVDDLLE